MSGCNKVFVRFSEKRHSINGDFCVCIVTGHAQAFHEIDSRNFMLRIPRRGRR